MLWKRSVCRLAVQSRWTRGRAPAVAPGWENLASGGWTSRSVSVKLAAAQHCICGQCGGAIAQVKAAEGWWRACVAPCLAPDPPLIRHGLQIATAPKKNGDCNQRSYPARVTERSSQLLHDQRLGIGPFTPQSSTPMLSVAPWWRDSDAGGGRSVANNCTGHVRYHVHVVWCCPSSFFHVCVGLACFLPDKTLRID